MDEELFDAVRQAAEEEGTTLSAFLAEAARDRVQLLVMRRVLDEWQEENGAFTEEEKREAEQWLSNPMTPEEALRLATSESERRSG
jgi:uncharacterized protein (DUF1778 family)